MPIPDAMHYLYQQSGAEFNLLKHIGLDHSWARAQKISALPTESKIGEWSFSSCIYLSIQWKTLGALLSCPGKDRPGGFFKTFKRSILWTTTTTKQLENLPADTLKETESWTFRTKYRSCVHDQNSTGICHLPWVWLCLCRILACKCGAQDLHDFKRFATSVNHVVCKRDFLFLTEWFSYQRTTFDVSCFSVNSEKTLCVWLIFGMSSLQKKGNSLWLTTAVSKRQNISVSNGLLKRLILWRIAFP